MNTKTQPFHNLSLNSQTDFNEPDQTRLWIHKNKAFLQSLSIFFFTNIDKKTIKLTASKALAFKTYVYKTSQLIIKS
jgi:hypothetical protein